MYGVWSMVVGNDGQRPVNRIASADANFELSQLIKRPWCGYARCAVCVGRAERPGRASFIGNLCNPQPRNRTALSMQSASFMAGWLLLNGTAGLTEYGHQGSCR